MKRLALLLLFPCAAPAAGDALSAMRDELARSRALRVPNLDAPYFIEYALDDAESVAISATLGGIVSQRRERVRLPEVRVRVGDYKFDNTNYAGGFYGGFENERFPLDDLYPVMRRYFWLATDNAYKRALEVLSRKRAALRNVALAEAIDDFARAAPARHVAASHPETPDEAAWAARLRALSALLAAYRLKNSSIEFEAIRSTHYYVNSEGSEARFPEDLVFLRARVMAQAPDGMTARDAAVFHARDLRGLPPEPDLARGIQQLGASAAALARAPRGEDYSGPVLFEGMASPQLFAEVLGRSFALTRRPVMEPGRPGAFPYSELDGREGARILPEFFDVVDDPTQTEWRGRRLFGSYPVDREGVAPKPVFLVEKGVLKGFLTTRQPVRGHSGSNGRARLPGSFGASAAAISNLFVRASETSTLPELKRKLIEICNTRGKPYGLLVRKMDFPSSASFEEVRRLVTGSAQGGSARPVSMPVLVYKVYPDGREELVRGLRFRGLNARSFKDVLAAADDENLFEFLNNTAPFALMGAGGYVAETCVVAPSVLIDDLELHPAEEELPKLPVVPPPV
ncbi:MAG: metallopeptidase TldD-related protein [Bryobacteraceae bacterium]